MPQGTNRIWYLTVIVSHNNLFVPHWHYTLIYGLPVQNVTFLSETKYTWIVHFIWPTIYLSTLYDRFKFKILVTIYIIERYLISNNTVDGYLISIPTRHNLSRSLHFSLFQVLEPFSRFYEVLCQCALL